jgi:ribosomal protein S18 acetylase RimI-like enzyme
VSATIVIAPLSGDHDRQAFSCGIETLDRYLQTQAGQDVRRRLSNCFVASPDTITIAGYYTLAAASIPLSDLPVEETRRLARYPLMPAALIGRLAIDRRYQKRSLGAALLFDAIERAASAAPAVFALIVDAKDDNAAEFYRHFGFRSFDQMPRRLFLPMATAATLLGR